MVAVKHYRSTGVLDQNDRARNVRSTWVLVAPREFAKIASRPLLFARQNLFRAHIGVPSLIGACATQILRNKATKYIERPAITPFGVKVSQQATQ